jgi:hypothetical protein
MNENPIAQLNTTSVVTYLNVLASVKTSIGNAAYKQLSTATNHFLAAVGKDLTSTVGPELLEEFPRSQKLLQARFHQRDLADSTYQSTHSRVAALRTAALNLIADHALPSDFPGALTALIKKAGYSFHEVELRFGGATEKWRHGLSAPRERSIGKLRELEEFLGAPNALLSRLPSLTFHASVVDEIDPIDRLPVDFGRCLRLLRSSKDLLNIIPEINFSHTNKLWRYYQLKSTAEGLADLTAKFPGLAQYLPSDDEGYNREIGTFDNQKEWYRFSPRTNDVIPILGDMFRWMIKAPSRNAEIPKAELE